MKFFMKGLLFLSRLAFLCNLLFVICLVLRYQGDFIRQDDIKSLVGILGWFMAPWVNLAVNIGYGIRLIRKQVVPLALAVVNGLFLLVQGYIHLF